MLHRSRTSQRSCFSRSMLFRLRFSVPLLFLFHLLSARRGTNERDEAALPLLLLDIIVRARAPSEWSPSSGPGACGGGREWTWIGVKWIEERPPRRVVRDTKSIVHDRGFGRRKNWSSPTHAPSVPDRLATHAARSRSGRGSDEPQ